MSGTIQQAPTRDPPRPIVAAGLDLYSDAFIDNPYETYARLRREDPVCRVDAMNAWFVTRHDDVKTVALDGRFRVDFERLQTNRMGPGVVNEPYYAFGREFMAFADPPHHTRLKKLFAASFGRNQAEAQIPAMKAIIDETIDGFLDRGRINLVEDFAHAVPLRIISGLLGIPEADRKVLEDWVEGYNPVIGFPPMTPEQLRRANEATHGFNGYFGDVLAERRARPGDDLISELLARNRDLEAPLDELQIVSNLILLYFAGQDTQKGHLGNVIVALHRHPDQLAWLREDPGRIWACVNELMRYDSVSQIVGRVAVQDLELRGKRIAEGQTVLISIGSANRDEAVFPDPDRFDLERPEARFGLAFGIGAHSCLGANFARLSIPLMVEALLRRLPDMEVDFDGLVRNRTLSKRGYGVVPVSWRTARAQP
ncbi:cytochrome P450 [Phenylobacterium sp.]|uniref:cytochrome P450 n=1 Tax=Phenylobacterium sp. TaxID=1871053 RepID=UPI00301BFAA1